MKFMEKENHSSYYMDSSAQVNSGNISYPSSKNTSNLLSQTSGDTAEQPTRQMSSLTDKPRWMSSRYLTISK